MEDLCVARFIGGDEDKIRSGRDSDRNGAIDHPSILLDLSLILVTQRPYECLRFMTCRMSLNLKHLKSLLGHLLQILLRQDTYSPNAQDAARYRGNGSFSHRH